MTSVMQSSKELKAIHDRLMADKPADAVHDADKCPLCAIDDATGEGMSETYTEAELQAKVDAAVAAKTGELEAKVTELTTAAQSSEVEKAKAAVQAQHEAAIAEVQKQLDASTLEAAEAIKERDAIKAWLDGEKAAAEEAKVVAERKDARLTKVKEVASFPDEYLTKHADRFAAMSDEDFEAACEGWAAISKKDDSKEGDGGIPTKTALHAGRESESGGRTSAVAVLNAQRRERGRVDLSSL